MHTLLFLDPGHFHAALLLKSPNPRIAPDVHVYAPAGAERDAFMALVDAFNTRADSPTSWQVHLHDAASRGAARDVLIAERRGDAVVLAGRNGEKMADIARLHEAGLAVLADKPWITGAPALPDLERACSGEPLAMDIMPDRHEFLARLRARIVAMPALFGGFTHGEDGQPAIELSSTHHLCKVVNGRALRRPAWYYDVNEQGDGLVDVQSHLTDQVQGLLDPGRPYDFQRDVALESARRWATPVPPDLFRDSTGEERYPQALSPWVRDGVLHYPCNGEIRYRLRGVRVRQVALWGQRESEGGGDLHGAVLRGDRAVLEVDHGAHTGFVPQVSLRPNPGLSLEPHLEGAIALLEEDFPGLHVERDGERCRFVAPASLHTTHESHFAAELERFLDILDAGAWPERERARTRTRYRILAEASALAAPITP